MMLKVIDRRGIIRPSGQNVGNCEDGGECLRLKDEQFHPLDSWQERGAAGLDRGTGLESRRGLGFFPSHISITYQSHPCCGWTIYIMKS